MGEQLQVSTEEEPPGHIPPVLIGPLLRTEIQIGDPFMSYITDCATTLGEKPELQLHVDAIRTANARLQRIVEHFAIPTDATYLPAQYQFQIASLSLALAHLVSDDEENNIENPYVQAIERLLRSAADHEVITEDINHLVVAVTVIDGLPEDLRHTFALKRQTFIDLYKSTRLDRNARHIALDTADEWLEMMRDQYAHDNVLRLTFPDRDAYNLAYEKICADFDFNEAEADANTASGMGLTNIHLAILCIEDLMNDELEAHEKEHLYRNLSVFGLFGDAVEEALVELESLKTLNNLHSIQDLDMTKYKVDVFYVREMEMLLQLHRDDPKTYELLNKMSFTKSTVEDAVNFSAHCIAHFGLEGLALLYLAGIVPLDDAKEKEDPTAFVGREYGKMPTELVQRRLEQLFLTYSSNLRVM